MSKNVKIRSGVIVILGMVALLITLTHSQGAEARKNGAQLLWVSGPKSETIRVGRAPDGRMCLPVIVNGQKYNFYVDTGASTTLHSEVARKLKINTTDSGLRLVDPLGHSQKLLIGKPTIRVGGYTVSNSDVVVTDLSGLRQMNMEQKLPMLDGILGSDILVLLRARLNFADSTIQFERPESNGADAQNPSRS